MAKRKTFFEQVPIKLVKRIAKLDSGVDQDEGNDRLRLETPAVKTSPYFVKVIRLRAEAVHGKR